MSVLARVRNSVVREKNLRKRIYGKGTQVVFTFILTATVFARTRRILVCIYKQNSIQRNRACKHLCTRCIEESTLSILIGFPTIAYCAKRFVMTIDHDSFACVKKFPSLSAIRCIVYKVY